MRLLIRPGTPRGRHETWRFVTMSHDTAASVAATGQRTTPEPLYGGADTGRRVTVRDIAAAKARGEKWPMLTAYDALTAGIFDRAGFRCCWSATRPRWWSTVTTPRSRSPSTT